MTYRQLADHVKQRQRLRWAKMRRPEDTWFPEVYFVRAGGEVTRLPIDTDYFCDRDGKAALVDILIRAIRAGEVRIVALQLEMFMLSSEHPVGQVILERELEQPERSPTEGLPRFQDIDGAREELCVHVFDAERHEAWHAPITRLKRGRPQLGRFELAAAPNMMSGDMVDPIKEALR